MNTLYKTLFEKKQLLFFIISMVLFFFAFLFQNIFAMGYLSNVIFVLSFIIGGYYKAKEGVIEFIETKHFNVDLLMVIAAIGSAIIGYFEEGAILIIIFSLSGALEEFVTARSTKELESLLELMPTVAHKLVDDQIIDTDVDGLEIGDCVVVRPGERIPVDGVITQGESSIDQATITGESIPVFAHVDTHVYTGTLNLTHNIVIQNTTANEERAVERVVQLIQEAQTKKSKHEQFVSRFNTMYVNLVLVCSVLAFTICFFVLGMDVAQAFYKTMVFLVVASPCAVVAATIPVTLSAISNGARHGILCKGGEVLEKMSDINFLAFDKTGTITKGEPVVVDVLFEERTTAKTFSILASLESQSTHPLAQAITAYLEAQEILPTPLMGVEDIPGYGVLASVDGHLYRVGSYRFVSEKAVLSKQLQAQVEVLKNEAKTLVYMSCDKEIIGVLALQDEVREHVPEVISQLQKDGIEPVMLTGDNEAIAAHMASVVGVRHYQSQCLPETKVDVLLNAQKEGRFTAMVGDGINDGPALAVADVGFAMGSGSELASQTADVVLMTNDLGKIEYAHRLSRKHNRVIRENICFALCVIATLIIVNFASGIELPFAVVFHEGSTILVILNGLRLLKAI